jgi:hypothetical protein
MATSGTTAYDRTGAQIAEQAARLIRIIGIDETLDTTAGGQEDQILESLNLMIKTNQMKLGLWRYREGKMFLVDGTNEYTLPPTASTNYACDVSELSETTLDADEASGQTTLSVTSTSQGAGFANSDVILVVQDDDTIHATTISSFVTDDTVTIASATTAAASSGNKVYVYTNAAPRPLKVISARRLNGTNEIEMFHLAREDYFNLPNKSSTGTPVQFFYDPQQTTGKVYLWPTPSTVDDIINYTYLDELEIISANTDTSNFPQEWVEYLVYGLAVRIAPMYGIPVSNEVLAVYTEAMSLLEGFDQDDASVRFGYSPWGSN